MSVGVLRLPLCIIRLSTGQFFDCFFFFVRNLTINDFKKFFTINDLNKLSGAKFEY